MNLDSVRVKIDLLLNINWTDSNLSCLQSGASQEKKNGKHIILVPILRFWPWIILLIILRYPVETFGPHRAPKLHLAPAALIMPAKQNREHHHLFGHCLIVSQHSFTETFYSAEKNHCRTQIFISQYLYSYRKTFNHFGFNRAIESETQSPDLYWPKLWTGFVQTAMHKTSAWWCNVMQNAHGAIEKKKTIPRSSYDHLHVIIMMMSTDRLLE